VNLIGIGWAAPTITMGGCAERTLGLPAEPEATEPRTDRR
jgi:hypothetical protein